MRWEEPGNKAHEVGGAWEQGLCQEARLEVQMSTTQFSLLCCT